MEIFVSPEAKHFENPYINGQKHFENPTKQVVFAYFVPKHFEEIYIYMVKIFALKFLIYSGNIVNLQ